MAELLSALVAALVGTILDRLMESHRQKRAQANAVRVDQLQHQLRVLRENNRIDREIEDESDLRALVDRL